MQHDLRGRGGVNDSSDVASIVKAFLIVLKDFLYMFSLSVISF